MLTLLCLASFAAGLVDSIAGGGGLILMPALLLSGLPPQSALGTNKLAGMCGTATALFNFMRAGKVLWKLAAVGLPFSLLGSVAGTRCVLLFDQAATARIILALLPVTALVTFLPRRALKTHMGEFSRRELWLLTPLICALVGFYDGFFGPGTGTFLILGFYAVLGLHMVNASAVAKVFNLASNVGSFVTFALAGKVVWAVGLPVALANVLGGYAGSLLAVRTGQELIRRTILLVFAVLFVSLALKYF